MFGGILLTHVHCSTCHSNKVKRHKLRKLKLAFPGDQKGTRFSVQSLIDFYCATELLTDNKMHFCGKCGGLREGVRVTCFETTPQYLVVVMKNCKFDPKYDIEDKLMQSISNNEIVNLRTKRSESDKRYTLYASLIHDHYYSLAKDSEKWYISYEGKVTSQDEEVQTADGSRAPCVLFYRRADITEGITPTFDLQR
ncbi:uncharacterized protein [Battus philenor]|uniref:uncharacterized protein n=1 Tax=Battus philenor TaxID=42288 RepID=UPI0035CECC8A